MRIAGVLSGTSLDGIDVAVCAIEPRGDGVAVACERFEVVPFAPELRARLLAAMPPATLDALEVSALHALVGDAFGEAVAGVAAGLTLDAVASHGITLAHAGDVPHSLQIGDAFRIRERTGVSVLFDFRSADTAAGGQGAPLVPAVDALLFGAHAPCVAVNLGGIANFTVLPGGIAFDAGPANLPIDTYVQLRGDSSQRFDRDGMLARNGTVDGPLLDALLDDPYLRLPPPKSTGRERYGAAFIARNRAALDALGFADAVATLTAFSARSLAEAILTFAPDARLAILSGGGTHNPALVDGLRWMLARVRVALSDAFGVDADAKEAIAFAVLGALTLWERPAGMPAVTGARGPRVLGAIAPQGLRALLERSAPAGGPAWAPEKHAR